MIKNYLKIAWRNLWRNKFFSTINILGLALGMACSVLIILWVQNELSVDSFHKNSDRLYAVIERQYYDHKIMGQYSVPGVLADEMKKTLPQVEYAVQMAWNNQNTFQVGTKILKLEGTSASADFFKMFSYPLIQGNAQTALNSPVSIALSRKMAVDFFGSPQEAIGKTIRYENKKDFKVTAVFEDLPHNVSNKFEFLINWDNFLEENKWAKDWGNNGPVAYIMLRAGANAALFDKKIAHFLDTYDKDQSAAFREQLGIQKFEDVYLHNNFKNGKPEDGKIEYVHLFSILAVFILVIACINFMNLTTARSVKRAREIGVRKVVGAVRSVLIRQFVGEAILLTCFAAIIALVIVMLLLPVFNSVTQKQIEFPFGQVKFWLGLVGLTVITGLLSGSYPALFLSSFNPVKVLKGAVKLTTGAAWFRKGLVVVQFMLSVVLIIGTIVISKQVNYIQTKNLGYDRENLIYIPLEGDLTAKYKVFKDEALNMPGIQQVTRISDAPTNFGSTTSGVKWNGKDPNVNVMFTQVSTGYDFVKTMKLKLVSGRDFSRDFATDSVGYIINETSLKRIGYTNPIGKPFTMWGKKGTIVGVLKDFHFNSLHDPILPLIIRFGEETNYGMALIRTKPGQTKQALASAEKLCRELNPNFQFSYYFADAEYQKQYISEQVVGKLSNAFAFLAIFISCLGLLGLAMFTAEQRIKEIGIRKVLGASVGSLFTLLSKEFLVLVLIALCIASPLAWLAMHKWLQGYSYRTSIDWWVFVLSGFIAILIALATVSFQSVKAALMNPVKSLRSE
ncbi:ABC transporter permease [Mucilaginibacter sp.]|uniref:ABC transporter permease n=1 Tax=Mucilaginibacter sp. TaxID=1882438 RepID=UPI002627A447|nr:ABC transporter permease [Mucilaginibacter sp.]MDB4918516.1 macB 22 [Mucilaginibacter sp.]